MPFEEQAPHLTPANMDEEPLKIGSDSIGESYALALVLETFNRYENFRSNNHDRRWNVHDELYLGWVPAKTWEGTNVPRANLGVPIVFDQVESIVPSISQALFNIGPEWFQVSADKGTDPAEAQQIQDIISYCLEHPKSDTGVNAKTEIELAIKEIALYGNGGIQVEWDSQNNRPILEKIDIKDFYIDPACSTPSVDDGRATIRRKRLSVEDLLSLASDPRMNIPSREILYGMSKNSPSAISDQTKRTQEAIRGVSFNPDGSDYVALPSDRQIEVLVYYSKSRIIWVLNREWVAYNSPNPYNFIPFDFAPCYIVPGRFYAQSVADVQEGTQRYIQALYNAHIDELTLALHPPRVMPRSSNMTPSQLKWKPGAVYTYENPKDVQVLSPNGATANIFTDIQYLEGAAEKRTGINGISGGAPRPSNANRTASGMQMQLNGSGNRLSHIVSNIENYLIVPALYKLLKILQIHTQPGQTLMASGKDGVYGVSSDIIHKPIKFRMSAASRMVTRDRLLQVFPTLAQFMFQGPLLQQLHATGKTVDFENVFQMLQDATNVGRIYSLIRPMSQQEQQAVNQPDPRTSAIMQKTQSDNQTKLQIAQQMGQVDLQKEQIKKQPDPTAQAAQQLQLQIDQQKAQMEMQQSQQESQQKLFMEAMLQKLKIGAEQEKHRMDMEAKKSQLQLQHAQAAQQMQTGAMTHQMKMQQMMDQLQLQNYSSQQDLEHQSEMGKTKLEGAKALNAAKVSATTDRPKKKAEVYHKTEPKKTN